MIFFALPELRLVRNLFNTIWNTECEDLIKKLLCTDPARRISLTDIAQHRWTRVDSSAAEIEQMVAATRPPPVLVAEIVEEQASGGEEEVAPFNEVVLKHMQTLNINREETIKVCALCA